MLLVYFTCEESLCFTKLEILKSFSTKKHLNDSKWGDLLFKLGHQNSIEIKIKWLALLAIFYLTHMRMDLYALCHVVFPAEVGKVQVLQRFALTGRLVSRMWWIMGRIICPSSAWLHLLASGLIISRLATMASERLLILQPHNWALRRDHGMLLYHSRRYGEAVQELSICMALAPVEEAQILESFVEKLHLMRLELSWKSGEPYSKLTPLS